MKIQNVTTFMLVTKFDILVIVYVGTIRLLYVQFINSVRSTQEITTCKKIAPVLSKFFAAL